MMLKVVVVTLMMICPVVLSMRGALFRSGRSALFESRPVDEFKPLWEMMPKIDRPSHVLNIRSQKVHSIISRIRALMLKGR